MNLLAVILAACTLAAHVNYNLGIRTEKGDVLEWGIISIDPKKPGIVELTPSELVNPPSQGCLGLQTVEGFKCQTLFGNIDTENVKATLARISPHGTLTQVQLVPGPRDKVVVEVPHFAPEASIRRPAPRKNDKPPQAKSQNTRAYRREDDEDEDETEQSFIEKYWKFLVPLALIAVINNFAPKPQSQ